MNYKLAIYNFISKLPLSFQIALMRMNRFPQLIFGREYYRNYKRLKDGGLSQNEVQEKVVSMFNFAVEHVPFYRERYGKIDSIEAFTSHVKFIDKDDVILNLEKFYSPLKDSESYDLQTTGGTSGKPLMIYQPKDRFKHELAMVHYAWSTVGYNFSVRGVLRNHKLSDGQKCRIDPVTRELQFDNFDNSNENFWFVYQTLKKYQIQFIHAYPSAAYQFALFCKREKLDLTFIKAFLCSSENVLPEYRMLIEVELGIKLFGFYGHTEKLVFAYNCPKSDAYHVEHGYGYFELINESGEIVVQRGEMGEICGTTLSNEGMPLIRYKTGDYAVLEGTSCPHCGARKMTLKSIVGRWNGDFIENLDGTKVSLTALNLHSDDYTYLDGLQYYHPYAGYVEVWIVPSSGFNDKLEESLLNQIATKFKKDMVVVVKKVPSLKKKDNGKFVQLIKGF